MANANPDQTIYIGAPFSGKSTNCDNLYVQPAKQKVIVIHPDGHDKIWSKYRFEDFRKKPLSINDFTGVVWTAAIIYDKPHILDLLPLFQTGRIVLDDPDAYFPNQLTKAQKSIFGLKRQNARAIDILAQSFGQVPAPLYVNVTRFRLFTSSEHPGRIREKALGKNYEPVLAGWQKINADVEKHLLIIDERVNKLEAIAQREGWPPKKIKKGKKPLIEIRSKWAHSYLDIKVNR